MEKVLWIKIRIALAMVAISNDQVSYVQTFVCILILALT